MGTPIRKLRDGWASVRLCSTGFLFLLLEVLLRLFVSASSASNRRRSYVGPCVVIDTGKLGVLHVRSNGLQCGDHLPRFLH